MRILLVMPFVPFPLTDGGRIGFFNPIKYLSRQHDLGVVTMATEDDERWRCELQRYCSFVGMHCPHSRSNATALLRSLVGYPPGTAAKYWDPSFGEFITASVAGFEPDIVEFHHLNTAAYGRFVKGVPKVFREHNIEYKVWERHGFHAAAQSERLYVRWCTPRVKAFEARVAETFDRCITVSEADSLYLRTVSPVAKVCTIPSGVDTEYFQPMADLPEEPDSMVLTGSFEWKPKRHNLRILLEQIFPRIYAQLPNASLFIVGKGIPEAIVRKYEKSTGIRIVGMVPDVRPYIQRASLVLNYLESGGGIALKVLEAMAMRRPVLSNSLGVEGIKIQHGTNIYIADGVQEYATAAVSLLKDRGLRNKLSLQGYALAHQKYAWNVIAQQFTNCYLEMRGGFHQPSALQQNNATPLAPV